MRVPLLLALVLLFGLPDRVVAVDNDTKAASVTAPLESTQPTTTEEPGAAKLTGVTTNRAEDLSALQSALGVNGFTLLACMVALCVLRLQFPRVYSENALTGAAAWKPPSTPFGWVTGSLCTSTEQAVGSAGLDGAMQIEFTRLATRIFFFLGLPMAAILCPLHYSCGGGKAGDDRLSSVGLGNVVDGHPWLYYLHAGVVWVVCLVVQGFVYRAQARFLRLRFAWLRGLPEPRSSTVLVEAIPLEYQTDERLRDFFSAAFSPEQVMSAKVVKRTPLLAALEAQRAKAEERKRAAELRLEKEEKRPTHRPRLCGQPVDSISHYEKEIEQLVPKIKEERARIAELADQPGGINGDCGFVTFRSRWEAEVALGLHISEKRYQWKILTAPEPSDVRWQDLQRRRETRAAGVLLGLAALLALFIFFLPICVAVTTLGTTINLGPLQPIWAGIAPSLGLTIFLGLLPTVMLLIFDQCFVLRANAWSQLYLQKWIFGFQLIYVLLVTAVGNSLVETARELVKNPESVFTLLASSLPSASNFYANYLVLQWAAAGLGALRYMNLIKYLLYRILYTDDEAKAMSESVDQGRGARAANLTILALVGLVYSSIAPLTLLLALITFAIIRLLQGYLGVFAETRSPDLGGAFWVTQLQHLQLGMLLYCALMLGLLGARAGSWYPSLIVAPSLIYMAVSYLHFHARFDWERLPFADLIQSGGMEQTEESEQLSRPELDMDTQAAAVASVVYEQPELLACQLDDSALRAAAASSV